MAKKHWLNRVYLALLALVLAAAVVALPLSWARYVAEAQVQASGRVASWDPYFFASPSIYSTAYLNGEWYEGPNTYGFCILTGPQRGTGTEVAANIKVRVRYEMFDGVNLPRAVTASSSEATIGAANQGITNLRNNYPGGSPGSGVVVELSSSEFNYAPHSWVWFQIDAKAITPAPSGTTNINNTMRHYKVFFDAEQID